MSKGDGTGYWVSSSNKVLPVVKHITSVLAAPKAFRITDKFIDDTYAKYGEPRNSEGKAREEIIRKVMAQGWIRVRFYRRVGWSVEFSKMSKGIKDSLQAFFAGVMSNKYGPYHDVHGAENVMLSALNSSYRKKYSVKSIAQDVLFTEDETPKRVNLTLISNEDLLEEFYPNEYVKYIDDLIEQKD